MLEAEASPGHVVLVFFRIRGGFESAFIERVRQQARDSLELEAGCLVFDVCVEAASSGEVVLYEVYTEAEAFAQHLASEHFKAFDAAVPEWVADKRVMQLSRLAP